MRVHLITMVGHSIPTLRPMLEHYASLGIESFRIYVHEPEGRSDLIQQVNEASAPYRGAAICGVHGDWLDVQGSVFSRMSEHPDDWFVIADQDEFQLYAVDLPSVLQECERHGFDHVRGALIDRVAGDGTLAAFDPNSPIWAQYPVGVFLTFPVCGGDCRKIVAAKGRVQLSNGGHHSAIGGSAYPSAHLFVQVHHFKWIAGVLSYLQNRRSPASRYGRMVESESRRFLAFFERSGGRIPLDEPGLLARRCDPSYPAWSTITGLVSALELFRRVGSFPA